MSTDTCTTEADIFMDIIDGDRGDFSPEVARAILNWRFPQQSQLRMTELADLGNKGALTEAQREELDRYLRVGSFVNLLQAKARLSLSSDEPADS